MTQQIDKQRMGFPIVVLMAGILFSLVLLGV